jgi:hypothetical protein
MVPSSPAFALLVPPQPHALIATPGWARCCAALEAVDAGYERGTRIHFFRAALRASCGVAAVNSVCMHHRRSLMRAHTHKHSERSAAQQKGARHKFSGLGGVQETYAILQI